MACIYQRSTVRAIEQLRHQMHKTNKKAKLIDFKTRTTRSLSLSKLTKRSTSNRAFSAFLLRLIDFLEAKTILETGTAVGINALYMAKSNADKIITLEGNKDLASIAKSNFRRFDFGEKIILTEGDLHGTFPQILRLHPMIDFIFLDADHRGEVTKNLIKSALCALPSLKVIVVHDIYWSKDMKESWQDMQKDQRFKLSIDIFQAGLLFPKFEGEKQHFYLKL